MPAIIDVTLDEENQIVVQRLSGDFDESDYERLQEASTRLESRLRDPSRIKVLADARGLGKPDSTSRQRMAVFLKNPNIHRIALWGCSPMVRTVFAFLRLASGVQKIRAFSSETEARAWLMLP